MSIIRVESISKTFDNQKFVVDHFSFTSNQNEFIVIVGGSGCGKTTLLRMIAGLEKATHGHIYLDDKDITKLPPGERDVAMVFQNYSLYPGMTVYKNLAFPLMAQKERKASIKKKVESIAEQLELTELLFRKPNTLSGGQQQRVAIGRALIRNPKLFLFDEPLSNLDASLREKMRESILLLHKQIQSTFVYVTHDQIEAMSLGDRIIVMNEGIIQQVGSPKEIYKFPINTFVAGFIGAPKMNFISKKLLYDLTGIDVSKNSFVEVIGVRPEHIDIAPCESAKKFGVVTLIEMLGKEDYIHVSYEGEKFLICKPHSESFYGDNCKISCSIKKENLHLFDSCGRRITSGIIL